MTTPLGLHAQTTFFGKAALLSTVPCAIFPILFSTAGFMTLPFEALLFEKDFILFGSFYMLYMYGLLLSWFNHKTWLPISLFVVHIMFLTTYVFHSQQTWLAYLTIFSIMGTSVVNQYFRTATFDCSNC